MGKGDQFERDISRDLSEWWTDGDRDDIYWRTSQSGGRATTRRKKGKSTKNQCGDVAATDPIGLPLVQLMTIELKRGYPKSNIGDVFDRPDHLNPTEWEQHWQQAWEASTNEGTFGPCLIIHRTRRERMIYLSNEVVNALRHGAAIPTPSIRFDYEYEPGNHETVFAEQLRHFLGRVTPDDVVDALAYGRLTWQS